MTRWSIKQILLYSHDGRRRALPMNPGEVNIISGRSSTGKSALLEIIDYAMASTDCFLPEAVRAACSWVGLLWVRDESCFLICRQVPDATHQSTGKFHVDPGPVASVPSSASDLRVNANRATAIAKLEEIFEVGHVRARRQEDAPIVSIRSAMPFVLVDDNVIINKKVLLRGADDDHRQSIIDTLPYFLGIVDESFVEKEAQLRQLRRRLERLRREVRRVEAGESEVSALALALAREAAALGMLTFDESADLNSLLTSLERAASVQPLERERRMDEQLPSLYAEESAFSQRASAIRLEIAATRRHITAADDFFDGAEVARRRLEVVNIVRLDKTDKPCPVCERPLADVSEPGDRILEALDRVRTELGRVERGRPKLDRVIEDKKRSLDDVLDRLASIRNQIGAVIRESERAEAQLRTDERRLLIAGRISFFLEQFRPVDDKGATEELYDLATQIDELEEEVAGSVVRERMDATRIFVSQMATTILQDLPFDPRHRNLPVDISFSDLSIGVVLPGRRVVMRNISGDENYLSLHLAMFLALHRYFYKMGAKVPGVLVLDQISRPFFPERLAMDDDDLAAVTQYFDVLFKEVERGESLQIIVLEHAYLKDSRFTGATRQHWRGEEDGLIPPDWPTAP